MKNGTWAFNDAVNGFCNADDIGKPRPEDWQQSASEQSNEQPQQQFDDPDVLDDPTILRICRERGVDPHDAEGKARIMLEIAPVDFARKMPSMYMDMVKQQRIEKAAQSAQAATLAQLSATRLRGMDDQDILLAFCNGLFAEPEEVRDRILARMGIDIKELMELLEQSD